MLNQNGRVDYVFGVDVACTATPGDSLDLNNTLLKLRQKTIGPYGVFLNRCFSDLVSAMKHADDTCFYCYRAIESLRHHCSPVHDLALAGKARQWEKFRKGSECDEEIPRMIKRAADPLHYGDPIAAASDDRASLLTNTQDVVDHYLKKL